MTKKRKQSKKKSKTIKDLHLDKPTSHGGWGPDSDNGSWNDKTPVNVQISKWLTSMGLVDDSNPRARLSESKLRGLIRKQLIVEMFGIAGPMLASLFTGCNPTEYNQLTPNIVDSPEGKDMPDCVTPVYYEPLWKEDIWKIENNIDGRSLFGQVPLDQFVNQDYFQRFFWVY